MMRDERPMRFLIFEDQSTENLSPLAMLRPVFELICGRESLRRRVQRWYPMAEGGVWIRPWLTPVYQEEHPLLRVNDAAWLGSSATLLVNGRWLPAERLQSHEVTPDNAGLIDGHLAWVLVERAELQLLDEDNFCAAVLRVAASRRTIEASGSMIRYPWDLVNQNRQQLVRDFADEGVSQSPQHPSVVVLGCPQDVYVSAEAEIDPFVVLDARTGPISIDRDVHIQSFTRIEGPCHISRGTKIFRALIRGGTTIGEHCRVGGEIENSVLHAFINKYHEGFLGHSYVCPWVNLGAMTTTSDLRNDYTAVRVPLQGAPIDSETLKVGSYIGDFTKTAIDSMFNAGSSIGVMAMVLPGGRLLPRHIPSFASVSFGELSADWSLEQSLSVAAATVARRDRRLSPATVSLLRTLYDQTEPERQLALERALRQRLQTGR